MSKILNIKSDETTINVELIDGRTITAPLVWFPRLAKATQEQRNNLQLLGDGEGIHWPDVDEDLSVQGLYKVLTNLNCLFAQSRRWTLNLRLSCTYRTLRS